MRRLGDGEIVLRVACLRAAIGADLARTPGLRGQPFAHVIAIAQQSPLQPTVAAVNALAFVCATVVYHSNDKAAFSELGRGLARSGAADVRIALLKDGRPLASARREEHISRESLAVAHRNHEVFFTDRAEIEL